MKLLTYNVSNDYRGNNEKAKVVWEIIVGEQVDAVGLQEVTPVFYKELIRQIPDSTREEEEDEYFVSECRDLVFITRTSISYRCTPFENTVMNRGVLTCDNYMGYRLINTHLESGPFNSEARVRQQEELFLHLLTETHTLLFGDMNFCLPHERFRYPVYYLEPSDISIYSYDSTYNENAIKPYRTMLDRFYSNAEIPSYLTRVLTHTTVSDHFPLLLLIRESDVHLSDSAVHPDSR